VFIFWKACVGIPIPHLYESSPHSVMRISTRSAVIVFVVNSSACVRAGYIKYIYKQNRIGYRFKCFCHSTLQVQSMIYRGVHLFSDIRRHTRHQWRESSVGGDVEKNVSIEGVRSRGQRKQIVCCSLRLL